MSGSGPKLVQTPGPATMPVEVLEALGRQSIDHRSEEFADLTHRLLRSLGAVFATKDPIVLYASSGTGAWEATMVNTLSPGDAVVLLDGGFFSGKWSSLAADLGFSVTRIQTPWTEPHDLERLREVLTGAEAGEIKAVCMVHGETSTGAIADVPAVRRMLDELGHPALLLVDAVSSALVDDYRHDAWGVDVTVCASQKGLMAPPGIGIAIVGARAREASATSTYPRHYWSWDDTISDNATGFFPRTPATNLLYALDAATRLILAETVPAALDRQAQLARAARQAVAAWGLALVAPSAEQSNGVTAFFVPDGVDSDVLHDLVLDRHDVATGRGLGQLKGRALRIGHLGGTSATSLMATLAATELGLRGMGVPAGRGALDAALAELAVPT